MLSNVVVVGASLAGLRACEGLRTGGYDGRITLVGAEPHLPYDRPPLSKKVLSGEWEPERIVLRKPEGFDELRLDLRLGVRARALDIDGRRVVLDDGDALPYDGVVLATGGTVRRLPGQPELAGVHVLRTLDDSLALRAELAARPRVVVIGAGFIGAEVAATARALGCEVTIVEALPVPLVRGLGPRMGEACALLHHDAGVHLVLGRGVDRLVGGARVEAVHLADGAVLPADVVVVGIGVVPAVDWLAGSGLTVADGVVCDATLAAGPPGVYAAGDLCRWPHPDHGEIRIEHWSNAAEQGAHAARNLLATAAGGRGEPYGAVPFFWSDQYGHRLQFLGRAGAADEVEVVAGSVDERRFVALYGHGGRLRGALGLDQPKLLMSYRALLARGASWDEALAHAST